MSVTSQAAIDLILGRFRAEWVARAPAVWSGGVPAMFWRGIEGQPPPDKPWVRVSIQHGPAGQRSLGAPGGRKFERLGLVTAQVFVPMSVRSDDTLLTDLGVIARDAWEGQSAGGVWFRNVRLQEVEPRDPWQQLNVVAEFSYEELR